MVCFDIRMHCEMISTVKLVYICIASHTLPFMYVCMVRTLKIYSVNKLQVYNGILLSIVTMLYISFSQIICLITGNYICVNQLSITSTNNQVNQFLKRKSLYWLTVLEVPVHDWLATLLLDLCRGCDIVVAGVHGHLMAREQRRKRSQYTLQEMPHLGTGGPRS
jgi:hypothetical protein